MYAETSHTIDGNEKNKTNERRKRTGCIHNLTTSCSSHRHERRPKVIVEKNIRVHKVIRIAPHREVGQGILGVDRARGEAPSRVDTGSRTPSCIATGTRPIRHACTPTRRTVFCKMPHYWPREYFCLRFQSLALSPEGQNTRFD